MSQATLIDRRGLLVGGISLAASCVFLPSQLRAQGAASSLSMAVRDIIRVKPGYFKTPGVSASIISGGKVLNVFDGLADPESRMALSAPTRFMSGSTGKTFCAATVMRLVEAGNLRTDQLASSFFGGEAWFDALPNSNDITVEHLLLHRAGFPQFLDLWSFQLSYLADKVKGNSVAYTPRQMLSHIADTDPLFPAGSLHYYSDLNYHLLGLIAEAAGGASYYELLETLVLSRMTRFADDVIPSNTTSLPRLAAGYAKGDLLGRLMGINGRTIDENGDLRNDPSLEYTGGGLALTPRSLAQFYSDLAEGAIVTPESFEAMLAGAEQQPEAGYGYGLYVTEREKLGRYVSHSGFYPGYTSNVGYFLDHGFAVAIQQNSDHGPELFGMLREVAGAVIDHGSNWKGS